MKRYILILAVLVSSLALNAQTDATLKKVSETYTLNTDGSIDYNYSKVMSYNTHYSFFSLFGETFVVYNPEYQDLKINHCYTIQKDGKRIDAPANAFNKVLPKLAADAPAYNHLTEMVITHTGLELGATVYLDYTITTKPEMAESLDIDRIFSQPGANILEYQLTVNIPADKKLNWQLTDSKVKPVVKNGCYTWTLRNLPAGAGEAYAPANSEGLPRLTATTAESVESALIPLTVETRDICRVPAEVLNGVSDKAEAIQNFVVKGLGNSGVLPEWTGYHIRPCSEVLRTAYGTVAEKAFAMARLMRAEGLDAEVVLVFPAKAIKSLKTIKNYLVRYNGTFYNVTSATKADISLRADRDEYYSLDGKKLDIGNEVKKIEDVVNITIGAENNLPMHGGYAVYTVPAGVVNGWNMNALHAERRGMCELPYRVQEKQTINITLDGMEWEGEPRAKNIVNKAGSVNISISKNGNTISVERNIQLNKSLFTSAEYADLRALLLAWESRNFRELLFSAE